MKSQSQKFNLIAIVGPTATGKSDLGVRLAKKFNGEVISADSRQVYKGLDIGSGKITKKEMMGIPHHLLDVVSPRSVYSVARFKRDANKAIADVIKRGNLPILVGGTGFWIDAVAENKSFPEVLPDFELRKSLGSLSTEKLFTMLKKLDAKRASTIDPKNKVRLVRAIEISKSGIKPSEVITESNSPYRTLYIGLDTNNDVLISKINKRLQQRMRKGLQEEVSALHKSGISWKRLNEFGLEYRFISEMLLGKKSKEETEKLLATAIWHYAKRQRTWFKRNKEIHWLDAADKVKALKTAVELVKTFVT